MSEPLGEINNALFAATLGLLAGAVVVLLKYGDFSGLTF